MSKPQLSPRMARTASVTTAGRVLAALLATIGAALARGETTMIVGFGTFATRDRLARRGRRRTQRRARRHRRFPSAGGVAWQEPARGRQCDQDLRTLRSGPPLCSEPHPAHRAAVLTASRHRWSRCPAARAAIMPSLCMVLLLVGLPAVAQQSVFDSYKHVQRSVFWQELYACGGATLYCGLPFEAGDKAVAGRRITIEHAYPADWIASHHGCQNRDSCEVEAYGRAAADLHNLWPAIGNINSSRQDQSLGEIPGEERRRFEDFCPDYERTSGTGRDCRAERRRERRYGALYPVHARQLRAATARQHAARHAAEMA